MDELELIKLLTRDLPGNERVVVGAGDDCAALAGDSADEHLLFKTDAVVEGVHFTADTPPEKIGRKALARCLSDIAAMAGTPTAALVTLALPDDFNSQRVESIYAGMNRLAREYDVAIVGGETTTNPDRVLVSISLLGRVDSDTIALRSGARPGDAIFVTGELGGSIEGKHLDFEPRLEQARWLAERFPLSSMIDLSDGLATDLKHILEASSVGADLLSSAVPISRAAREVKARSANGKTPLSAALSDGEDFELLLTLPSKHAVPLNDAWKKQFSNLKLSCVGKTTETPGLRIRDQNSIHPMAIDGYVHFKKP